MENSAKHQSSYAVQVRHCTKTFGKVVANNDVHFDLKWGEIHALLGENGSGKTTLVNMLAGIYQPDEGEICIDGQEVHILSPKDAYHLGIGMIHQHFMLVDVLTALENIVLGLKGSVLLNRQKIVADVQNICDKYGFRVRLDQKIRDMSVSEKQTVEIVKALYRGAEILILDEPTAVLTPQETDKLFDILKSMKAQGKAIVLISHKMNELFAVADRITILRKGAYIDEMTTQEATVEKLTNGMVGHAVNLDVGCTPSEKQPGLMTVENLSVTTKEGIKALNNVSFTLCGGEILGVAGIAGSGQKELCDAIAGLVDPSEGKITLRGQELTAHPGSASVAYVPEDRLGVGLLPDLGMTDNIMLRSFRKTNAFFLDRKTPQQTCNAIIKELDVSTPDTKTPVRRLSGGNVQKVLLGREIHENPDVLIAAYPVRGLDIGASRTVYELMNEQKARGAGVLFIGEDLDMLMGLCDRVMVLCNGSVAGIVDPREVSKNDIGLMMMGERSDRKEEQP